MANARMKATAWGTLIVAAAVSACGGSGGVGSEPAATPAPALGSPPAAAPSGSSEASTLDGVYTATQAERGRAVFDDVCVECHTVDDWMEDGFKERWSGESVWRFWHYIWEQMPDGEPPYTLSRTQVTDVMTYILELNGLPTGAGEMGTDDDSLDVHWLVFPGYPVPGEF